MVQMEEWVRERFAVSLTHSILYSAGESFHTLCFIGGDLKTQVDVAPRAFPPGTKDLVSVCCLSH